MRHNQRKKRWPFVASLLAHSLFIGIGLSFAVFGTRIVVPEAMTVSIVSSIKGDSESSELVQRTESPPQVIAPADKAKPKQFEEEKARDIQPQIEQPKEPDPPETTEGTPAALPSPGDYVESETMTLTGSVPGSTGTGSVSTSSEDSLAGFMLQVRQAIERHKQYPRRARYQGIEGTTQLRFRILPTGEPAEIQVVQSSQSMILDEEAVAAVKRVKRFPQPPVKSPLGIMIRLPFVFHLEEGG